VRRALDAVLASLPEGRVALLEEREMDPGAGRGG
jgi:hypothetical protein